MMWVLGDDGLPEGTVDTGLMQFETRRIAALLAARAHDIDAVTATIEEEITAKYESSETRRLVALLVLADVLHGILAPLRDLVQRDHPERVVIADLYALANAQGQAHVRETIRRARERADLSEGSRGPRDGDSSPESET